MDYNTIYSKYLNLFNETYKKVVELFQGTEIARKSQQYLEGLQ